MSQNRIHIVFPTAHRRGGRRPTIYYSSIWKCDYVRFPSDLFFFCLAPPFSTSVTSGFFCGRFVFSLLVSFDIGNAAWGMDARIGRESIHVGLYEEHEHVRTSTMNERTGISAVVSTIASWEENDNKRRRKHPPQPRTTDRRPNKNTNDSIPR